MDSAYTSGGHYNGTFLFKNFQAVLVASRRALTDREGALNTVHEILERLEAHLKADGQFTVRIFSHLLLVSLSFL